MTVRRYRMGRRRAAMSVTRARILAAARALLTSPRTRELSLDAVARRARVARMTVYHQFGNRRALLEALFDQLAAEGGMGELRNAFQARDPEEALARVVATFGRFWTAARPIHRRLRALGVLDPGLGRALDARQEWRRQGLRVIAARLVPSGRPSDELIDVLFTLTAFETFDTLAGQARTPEEATPAVQRLVRAALDVERPS